LAASRTASIGSPTGRCTRTSSATARALSSRRNRASNARTVSPRAAKACKATACRFVVSPVVSVLLLERQLVAPFLQKYLERLAACRIAVAAPGQKIEIEPVGVVARNHPQSRPDRIGSEERRKRAPRQRRLVRHVDEKVVDIRLSVDFGRLTFG